MLLRINGSLNEKESLRFRREKQSHHNIGYETGNVTSEEEDNMSLLVYN